MDYRVRVHRHRWTESRPYTEPWSVLLTRYDCPCGDSAVAATVRPRRWARFVTRVPAPPTAADLPVAERALAQTQVDFVVDRLSRWDGGTLPRDRNTLTYRALAREMLAELPREPTEDWLRVIGDPKRKATVAE